MFDLKIASSRAILLSCYTEEDMEFLVLMVPRVRFLITQNPNYVLDQEHKTKLPVIMGWNLVKLAYQKFMEKKHNVSMSGKFQMPEDTNPLIFSQLCIHYCVDIMPAAVRYNWKTAKCTLKPLIRTRRVK